ncbi:MAG: AbgT family transporter [Clostridiales bacterium]|nr:AbgT family transporter [Clostridiales bacterium]
MEKNKNEKTKKKELIKLPSALTILLLLALLCAVLTWIIPTGNYDTEVVDGTTTVVAGTYHLVERTPVGLFGALRGIVNGFANNINMIMTVFMVGGVVRLMTVNGTFDVAFGKLAANKRLNANVIVFICMLFMSFAGCAAVIANSTVAFMPIGVILAASLGYDAFTGLLIIFLGAYSGFNVGWINTATLLPAQTIAELPIFSGLSVRLVIWVINFLMCYIMTIRYMKKVKADPMKSLNYYEGMEVSEYMGMSSISDKGTVSDAPLKMTWRHTVSLIAFLASFVAILIGSVRFEWGNVEIAATFLGISYLIGIISGYGLEGTSQHFLEGCRQSLAPAFFIGIAGGISVILTEGNVLNTVVYWLSKPLTQMGPVMAANFMFVANMIINLFIGSGSGQAAVVMPLMTPLADLVGVTRQVAVQAFQFGDGFSNCLYPVGGTLMANLELAKVSWFRYVKWFAPLFVCQTVLAFGSLTILQMIGWTGL